ncbi:MAG: peptide chain release factor N(5)-glutamine methyltransferase [Clostridium sp.]
MNIGEALIKSNEILKREKIHSYVLDSQLLMCKVLKKEKIFIIMNRDEELTQKEEEEFLSLIKLRKEKMPIKYILGETEFMGINILLRKGVLIPRADTEVLVEEVLRIIKDRGYSKICDLCSGSGAIGISICTFIKDVTLKAYDIDKVALEVTELNIKKLGLSSRATVEYSDLLKSALEKNEKFDLVVSNPPYIRTEVIESLMKDVKDHEPHIALCGGDDGLMFYRKITKQSLKVLKSGGVLAYEIGYDQRNDVINILNENGFVGIYSLKDFGGNHRVVIGFLPKQ